MINIFALILIRYTERNLKNTQPSDSLRKLRKKKGAYVKPTSISGGQRPQLDCNDIEQR